ncbi:MAG TPA: archaemetzincin family Zn-dependent metalloprotease [Thermoanaerobaculia bacterium]
MGVTTAGGFDSEAAEFAALCISSAFSIDARRLEPMPDPAYAWDEARQQYSSTLILRDAISRRPAGAARVLVLTERDIFIPMLSFVYGQAQLDGPVAVLSSARLRQEFYSLPPNRPLFLLRLRKEIAHELGHTFGLTHCQDRLCTMSLSTNIEQLDLKQAEFCDSCAILVTEAVSRIRRSMAEGRTE